MGRLIFFACMKKGDEHELHHPENPDYASAAASAVTDREILAILQQ